MTTPKLETYRVLKTHTVWEYATIEATSVGDAWHQIKAMNGSDTCAIEQLHWLPYKEGDAEEEIIHIEED